MSTWKSVPAFTLAVSQPVRATLLSDSSTDSQLLDLRRYVRERGWDIFREYVDEGISGTKDSRPALNELMNDAKKRRFDVVLVWRFDRFARSTRHLINALEEFKNLRIDFVSYQENIDTSSPLGSAIFTIISAVAQLEREHQGFLSPLPHKVA